MSESYVQTGFEVQLTLQCGRYRFPMHITLRHTPDTALYRSCLKQLNLRLHRGVGNTGNRFNQYIGEFVLFSLQLEYLFIFSQSGHYIIHDSDMSKGQGNSRDVSVERHSKSDGRCKTNIIDFKVGCSFNSIISVAFKCS